MATSTDLKDCAIKGSEMSLYYDTADIASGSNNCATPVWVLNKAVVGDLEIGHTSDKEEQTVRDPAVKFKQYTHSKPDLEITGEMVIDPQYEGYSYFQSMSAHGKPKNILALTSYLTTVGAFGFKGKFSNFDLSMSGPETGNGRTQFSLAPAACVASGCIVVGTKVASASTLSAYDYGAFDPAPGAGGMSAMVRGMNEYSSIEEAILNHSIYLGLKNTSSEVVYTDVSPLIAFLGVDAVDKLITDLIQVDVELPTTRSGYKKKAPAPQGIAEFNRIDLLAALDEIAQNSSTPTIERETY